MLRTLSPARPDLPDISLPLAKNASVTVVDYEEGVFTVVEGAIDAHIAALEGTDSPWFISFSDRNTNTEKRTENFYVLCPLFF